jgi:hypothetical protein
VKRFKRSKPKGGACAACGRMKGDLRTARCPRCPGQPVSASLALEPLRGVRIVAGDPSMTMCGLAVTSPTHPGRLEVATDVHALAPELDDLIGDAVARSEHDGAPIWLVLEDPGMGGERATPAMLLGLGQAIGCMRRTWALAGGLDSRVILVRQITWQAGLMPGHSAHAGHADREERSDRAVELARVLWGPRVLDGSPITWSPDTSAAALLAHFSLRWPDFLDRVGVRDRARAAEVAARGAGARPAAPIVTPAPTRAPSIAAAPSGAPDVATRVVRESATARAAQGSLFG